MARYSPSLPLLAFSSLVRTIFRIAVPTRQQSGRVISSNPSSSGLAATPLFRVWLGCRLRGFGRLWLAATGPAFLFQTSRMHTLFRSTLVGAYPSKMFRTRYFGTVAQLPGIGDGCFRATVQTYPILRPPSVFYGESIGTACVWLTLPFHAAPGQSLLMRLKLVWTHLGLSWPRQLVVCRLPISWGIDGRWWSSRNTRDDTLPH